MSFAKFLRENAATAGPPTPEAVPGADLNLEEQTLLNQVLIQGIRQGASDIEIIEGQPPVFRLHRTMQPQDLPVLERSDLESILSPDQLEQLSRNLDIDVSYSVPGVSRFRVNIYHDRGGLVAVFRTIPQNIPDLRKLGLPDVLLNLTEARSGLILVTGPTGSGKSTTLAALIKHINQTRAVKIITIEDPVEYLHTPIKARISQRQVGVDVKDFERGLRAALRQAPDIILVGEMRDRESIEMALTAAETGHLVFSTLHTRSADETAARIVDAFPEGARPAIRAQLSSVILAVVSQQLVPRQDQSGLVVAYEVMLGNTASKSTIRDGKFEQLRNVIEGGSATGMISMNRVLANLVQSNTISTDTALAHSPNEEQLLQYLGMR